MIRIYSIMSLFAATLFLSGCSSLEPVPLTTQEVAAASAADESQIQKVEPLTGSLTLEEAIARAIKYNLERRVRSMEEALAAGQLEVANYDMLPKLVASAGYRDRNNDLITRSKDSVTGAPSLADPYISSDRAATTGSLSFTWSLLDFGQSYYAAKQSADRALIAQERRRKATHTLIQDVRTAFWRAASAQKLQADVRKAIADAEDALADSRKAEAEKLRNPLDALRYQRQLLENLRLLESVNQELSTAKIELLFLVNLPLAREVAIVEPTGDFGSKWLETPMAQLEEQAIAQNADLREAHYNTRIARNETRRVMLRMFPGISFNYGTNTSNDSYLINQRWNEAGVQISMNLLGLLSGPAQRRMADAGVAVADQQRMATLMRVLTQVHLARQELGNSVRQFDRANAIWQVDQNIAEQVARRESVQTQTKLDRIANQTSAILSQLRRYQAKAQVYAAASKLQASLGMELVVDDKRNLPLAELTNEVGNALHALGENRPDEKPAAAAAAKSAAADPAPAAVAAATETAAKAVPTAAEIAIDDAVTTWAGAWSRQAVPAYLDAYAKTFVPAGGLTFDEWADKRKATIERAKGIRVDIADLAITVQDPQHATAVFGQNYHASNYADVVRKTLDLEQIDGRWLIVRETNARLP
ncbi:MAG: TolC family protein [Rhodocyclaceae bacterium]|nr:TolC family protein [Rhodocyclaceae bacterium]